MKSYTWHKESHLSGTFALHNIQCQEVQYIPLWSFRHLHTFGLPSVWRITMWKYSNGTNTWSVYTFKHPNPSSSLAVLFPFKSTGSSQSMKSKDLRWKITTFNNTNISENLEILTRNGTRQVAHVGYRLNCHYSQVPDCCHQKSRHSKY